MTFERLTPKSSLSPELQTFFCSGCGEVETLDTRDIMFHLILTSIPKSLRVQTALMFVLVIVLATVWAYTSSSVSH